MDSPFRPFSSTVTCALLFLASLGMFLPCVNADMVYSTLVYKKCANQTFAGSPVPSHSRTFSSIFHELLAASSHSRFFKTTAGDESFGISALFQCRGDLGNQDCYDCVNKLPDTTSTHCKQALAARIQLNGCYFRYETDEIVDETPKNGLLHETCSENEAVGSGFEELRDAAFAAAKTEVVQSADGFYETNYGQYVHVLAQCQGDLGACDCGECISLAGEVAQEKCGSSVSGQVYLDKCYLSYTYYPDGIPGNSYQEEKDTRRTTGKTVAILLGVLAALGAGFIALKLIKSCSRKDNA